MSKKQDEKPFIDVTETIEQKIEALKQHASQLGDWDPTERIKQRNAKIGEEKGLSYAEKYRVIVLLPPDARD